MGGERWGKKSGGWGGVGGCPQGTEKMKKEASPRKQRGTGKVSKKAFPNDRVPYDFSKLGR